MFFLHKMNHKEFVRRRKSYEVDRILMLLPEVPMFISEALLDLNKQFIVYSDVVNNYLNM